MLISAMNFARHFIAWQQKSLRTYATDVEAKAMLLDHRPGHARRRVLHLAARRLPELLDRIAPHRVQPRLDRDRLRPRQPGLRRVAGVRADDDPDAFLLLRKHRLHRRRHQDVPHAGAVPAGGARAVAAGAPASRHAGQDRRPGGGQQDRVRRARVRRAVFRHGGDAHLHAARERPRFSQFVLRDHRLHQQRRARASAWSARRATTRASPISRPGSARSRCCSAVSRSSAC